MMFVCNGIMNLLRNPWVGGLAVGRELENRLRLPEY
jgi:hypothetical protein